MTANLRDISAVGLYRPDALQEIEAEMCRLRTRPLADANPHIF